MQGFNHIAGGITFTGIFASFHDVNVFEKPEYLGVTVVFALLPDIDHTRSIIGKAAYPLARWLSIKFGHRTITHSLAFYVGVLLIVRAVELLYLHTAVFSVLVGYSLLSHLIFDMCTRQGIQLFYPFSYRPCVLPANPSMRLRTNDLRSEAIIFIVFCSMMLFCMPLFTNGFWLQYNKQFLNYDHIQRESKRKGDLLEISFIDIQKDTVKGVLINQTETTFITSPPNPLSEREGEYYGFQNYQVKDCKFLTFRHTGKPFVFRQIQVFGVSPDSIKTYLKKPLLKLQIQCTADMKYFDGAVMQTGKTIEKEFIQGFDFFIEPQDQTTENAAIEALEAQISQQKGSYNHELEKLDNELYILRKELSDGTQNYNRLSDYGKGQWQQKSKELGNEIKSLEHTQTDKEPPQLAADLKRLELMKAALKMKDVKVNGNFVVWEW